MCSEVQHFLMGIIPISSCSPSQPAHTRASHWVKSFFCQHPLLSTIVLKHTLSLTLSLSLPLSHTRTKSPSLSVSCSPSLSPSVSVSLPLSVSLSLCQCLSLPLPPMSVYLSLPLCLSLCRCLSPSMSLPLSPMSVSLSLSLSVSVSHLLPGNLVLLVLSHWLPGWQGRHPTYLLILLADHIRIQLLSSHFLNLPVVKERDREGGRGRLQRKGLIN